VRISSPRATFVALMAAVLVTAGVRAQPGPDLTGRWELNAMLSQNAETKLAQLHAGAAGEHGPRRHGRSSPDKSPPMAEMRDRLLNPAAWFVLTQDGDRVTLTGNDGRVRTMTANDRKANVGGYDVRTRWDDQRLICETALTGARVIETFERSATAPQLTVTTTVDMGGQVVSVRRVYDASNPR
jgi:hypothetical protein